jgi:peptidylprolyl isomerase
MFGHKNAKAIAMIARNFISFPLKVIWSRFFISALLLACVSCVVAEEAKEPTIATISEAFGHLMYRNFKNLNLDFDIAKMVRGIQDAADEKESPMDFNDCIDAINAEQKKNHKIQAENNLKQAEQFLETNATVEGVVSLKDGKVQYKVITPGNGPEIAPHSNPRLRSNVKTLDDVEIYPPDLNEKVSLDQMIEGLRAGILGMKEGEKRIVYVHPDLSFKSKELYFIHPNALIVFEIEALKI